MPALTELPATEPTASAPSARSKTAKPDAARLQATLSALKEALAAFSPADSTALARLTAARADVAASLIDFGTLATGSALANSVIQTLEALAQQPAAFLPVTIETSTNPTAPQASGWLGSIVQLFIAPAWQHASARTLDAQPTWLWSVYAHHVFSAPAYFQDADQENRWAAHNLTQLDSVVRMLEGNRGSSAVRSAAQLALDLSADWPAFGHAATLRRRQQSLGKLRSLLAPRIAAPASLPQAPFGLVRVGLIVDTAVAQPGAYAAEHLKPLLDAERIELVPQPLDTLPADLVECVETLRLSQFDALIFAGDFTASDSPLAALATHRIAPRQFATALTPVSTGLANVDVIVTDTRADASAFTEQLAVLPAALAFQAPGEVPAVTRADFGLPENARLIFALAHPAHASAAIRDEWQTRLDQDAAARLVLLPATSGPALDLLLADCERRFGDRLILAGNAPLEAGALASLLRVGDAFIPGTATGNDHAADLARHFSLAVSDSRPRVDTLAFADALTHVIETACREPGSPLVAPEQPADFHSRQEQANSLLILGRADRAVANLLAAVEDPDAGADVWHDLALALQANNQFSDAIQALETCVRIDAARLDSWLLLADWAINLGHADLPREILEVVQALAPTDLRVNELAARLAV